MFFFSTALSFASSYSFFFLECMTCHLFTFKILSFPLSTHSYCCHVVPPHRIGLSVDIMSCRLTVDFAPAPYITSLNCLAQPSFDLSWLMLSPHGSLGEDPSFLLLARRQDALRLQILLGWTIAQELGHSVLFKGVLQIVSRTVQGR